MKTQVRPRIGDRVRVITVETDAMKGYVGRVGTVEAPRQIPNGHQDHVSVRFDKVKRFKGTSAFFKPEFLQLESVENGNCERHDPLDLTAVEIQEVLEQLETEGLPLSDRSFDSGEEYQCSNLKHSASFQELGDSTYQQENSESEQPSLLRSIHSANKSCEDTFQASLSTTTSELLTQREESGKFCLEDFHARTAQQLIPAGKELMAIAQDSGEKCSGSLGTSDRDLLSSKTLSICGVEDLPLLSTALPKAGMWDTTSLWLQPTLERPTLGKGYSLLPTPMSYSKGSAARRPGQSKLDQRLRLLPKGGQLLTTILNPHIREDEVLNPAVPMWMMGFPAGWITSTTQVGGQQIQLLQSAESRVEPTLGDTTNLNASAMPSCQELPRSPFIESSTSTRSPEKVEVIAKAQVGEPPSGYLWTHQIEVIPAFQQRVCENFALVNQYKEMLELSDPPPLLVYSVGDRFVLVDGFHRLHALKSAGRELISAIVREGTWEDALIASCTANAYNGQAMTSADKRRAVNTMLETLIQLPEEDPRRSWSNREIARQTGASEATVRNIKVELEMSAKISHFTEGDRVQVVRSFRGSGGFWPEGTLGRVQELDKKKDVLVIPDTSAHLDRWMLSHGWIHPDNLVKSNAPWSTVKISQDGERADSLPEPESGSVLSPQDLVTVPKSKDKQLLPDVARNGDTPPWHEPPTPASLINAGSVLNGKPDVVAAEIAIGIKHLSCEQIAWVISSAASNGLSDDCLLAVIKAAKQALNERHHPEYFPNVAEDDDEDLILGVPDEDEEERYEF